MDRWLCIIGCNTQAIKSSNKKTFPIERKKGTAFGFFLFVCFFLFESGFEKSALSNGRLWLKLMWTVVGYWPTNQNLTSQRSFEGTF